jgi:hypothetical protein
MLPSGLPEHVDDQEELARFLTQSSQFNAKMVKPTALLPNPKDGETSVSRHGPEPGDELWKLGLAAAGERPLYGAAIFEARVVRAAQLEVLADEPPPRHAVIQGWPRVDNDPELQKARQKELAAIIVSASGPPLLR